MKKNNEKTLHNSALNRLQAGRPLPPDAIAVVGMAFRFPGNVCDEASMWRMLAEGRQGISSIPEDRWPVWELQHGRRSEPGRSVTFAAGTLDGVERFDAAFFGISPREAAWLDPQQRLLLEMTWEALEDANIVPSSLAGSRCGVYIGISGMDYGQHALEDLASMTAHTMTGNTLSIAANRLSYFFDLHGPSLAVDTACSSSLVALHQACRALHSGDASMALAGGVSLLMHPYSFIGFSHASMLSAKGRCRPFDAEADGYVRAEGGGVLLLKPLRAALEDGDRVHALILASGVNADGSRKSGLTIPSREAQSELMREVLACSGLTADDLDFIEAHGTGTPVGDPVEAASIGDVYGSGRKTPLPISSVKANFGHLEPASGMAGLVKAIISLKKGVLPPVPFAFSPNPHIDFTGCNVLCPASGMELRREGVRAAGVNSFGFGGVNAHVIIQSVPEEVPQASVATPCLPPLLLTARSDNALRDLADAYARQHMEITASAYYDMAYTAAFHRERMEKRLLLSVEAASDVAPSLQAFAQGEQPENIVTESALSERSGIAFIYTGNGAQWAGMGRALYEESSVFRRLVHELDHLLRPMADFSLVDVLLHNDAESLSDTTISQPLLFAVQLGITLLLREEGIRPQAVAGHSVGEIAAAWAAGALSLEQAVQVIHARSHAQGQTRGLGRMAAAGLSAEAAADLICRLGLEEELEIAGINSPSNITLSGSLDALTLFQAEARQQKAFFCFLDLDYAFHSRKMEGIRETLAEKLRDLRPRRMSDAIFASSVTGEVAATDSLDGEYWWQNVRQPVNFSSAIQSLAACGLRLFVEIGPHAILQRYIRENLSISGTGMRVFPSLSRGEDGLARIRRLAARLHLLAEGTDLRSLFPRQGRRVPLPHYVWQKQSYRYPRTSECMPERRRIHPLLGWPLQGVGAVWENILDPAKDVWLADHRVGEAIVYPGAAYAEMALAAAKIWLGTETVAIESLDIAAPLVFENDRAQCLRCHLNAADGSIRIVGRSRLGDGEWTEHATARAISVTPDIADDFAVRGDSLREMSGEALYALTQRLGLEYGDTFRVVRELRTASDCLEADLLPVEGGGQGYVLPPAALDACFHSLAALYAGQEDRNAAACLPIGTGRITVVSSAPVCRIRGRVQRCGRRSLTADFVLLDASDRQVARAADCRFRAVPSTRGGEGVSAWRIQSRLAPLPDAEPPAIPPLENLVAAAESAVATLGPQRTVWFREVLPLMEAAVLSAGVAAFRAVPSAARTPQHPYASWLHDLLCREGLTEQLQDSSGSRTEDALPAAEELCREAFRRDPQCLPALLPLGRVCRALPDILRGALDGRTVLREVRNAVVTRESRRQHPHNISMDAAADAVILELARHWPTHRHLRILEVAETFSGLTERLEDTLPSDHFVHILALPETERQALPRYGRDSSVMTVSTDPAVWNFAAGSFDVVLFRQCLHVIDDDGALLDRVRQILRPGGLLLLTEQYPDWSTDLIEGLDPDWWHADAVTGQALSPLRPPQAWQSLLAEHQWQEISLFREPAAEGLDEGAYLLLARSSREPAEVAASPCPAATWRFLADAASQPLAEEVCARLAARGQQAHCLVAAMSGMSLDGVDHLVFMRGYEDTPDSVTDTLEQLRRSACDGLAASPSIPRLWIVTCGGALASILPDDYAARPAQCAVAGLGRVIMQECGDLHCTLVDIPPREECPDIAARLEREFLASDGHDEILLMHSARHALMLEPAPVVHVSGADENCRLDFAVPGRLANLRWQAESRVAPEPGQIEARVMAVGLNFRDVMLTMGLLTVDAVQNGFAGPNLGLEFAGIVTRTGEGVQHPRVGDRVSGFAPSCFAGYVRTPAYAVMPTPAGWSHETAAAVPTVFFTAWYALRHLARLGNGERLLVHGAAGGVGIAAIQIARHLGATIFATAGSDEKRDFLRLLGVEHVYDSRSLSFADGIMAATDGQGVDVVLNSLAGEAMRRSIGLLRPFGRFLELGKRDFVENTGIGLRPFKENISYFAIDVDQLLTARPDTAASLFREVTELLRQSTLVPPPYRLFPATRTIAAFRAMQQAQHMGKIVVGLEELPPVAVPSDPAVRLDSGRTWLVTGGLGGFGLATARHLVELGIRHLVLVSRRGALTPGAEQLQREFGEQGVAVQVHACDMADAVAVRELVKSIGETMPPLGGVVHAAAVFEDRLLTRLDKDALARVVEPKLTGAWNLHEATRGLPLTHFILYSSISVALGNPGQGNYVAANAGLEGLTMLRRRMGLPALCIAWGPVGDAGYLTRNEGVKKSLAQHLGRAPLTSEQAMRTFDGLLSCSGLHIAANVDWRNAVRLFPGSSARFAHLAQDDGSPDESAHFGDIQEQLAGKTPEEARGIVRHLIIAEVAQVLGLEAEQVPVDRGVQSLGLDSLMAVELAAGLEQRTGVRLPVMMLQDSPTVEQIAERLVSRLTGTASEQDDNAAVLAVLARRHAEDAGISVLSGIVRNDIPEGSDA